MGVGGWQWPNIIRINFDTASPCRPIRIESRREEGAWSRQAPGIILLLYIGETSVRAQAEELRGTSLVGGAMPLAVGLYGIVMCALDAKGATSGNLDGRCGSHVRRVTLSWNDAFKRRNNIDQTSWFFTLTTIAVDQTLTTR